MPAWLVAISFIIGLLVLLVSYVLLRTLWRVVIDYRAPGLPFVIKMDKETCEIIRKLT